MPVRWERAGVPVRWERADPYPLRAEVWYNMTTGTGTVTYATNYENTSTGYYTYGSLGYTRLTVTDDIWANWVTPEAALNPLTTTALRPPTYHRNLWGRELDDGAAENAQRADAEAYRGRAEADRQESERRQRRYDRHLAAEARAEELLLMVLTPAERAHYQETEQVIITGSDGRRYRIGHGVVGNVSVLTDTGRVVERWCAHPHEYDPEGRRLPDRDLHVGQILALRHNAPEFIERANLHWRAGGVLGVVVAGGAEDDEEEEEEDGPPDGIAEVA